MAAVTMILVCLRAARMRNRPDRRCWAARAMPALVTPLGTNYPGRWQAGAALLHP